MDGKKRARQDKHFQPPKKLPGGHGRTQACPIRDILPAILSQYGIGRNRPEDDLAEHWETLAGTLASQTFVLGLRRGMLEIGVTNSIFIQELTFQKQDILKKLQALYPDGNIRGIRFRVEKKGMES